MRVTAPRFEHLVDALGIGVARPRLSWATETDRQGWLQSAYQVEVTRDAGASVASVWVEDGDSVLRPWPFPPLASRERATVRVRVRGADAETSPWSEPSPVEAGLLAVGDWSARMVSPAWEEDTSTSPPAPLVRRAFTLRDGIARARLYVTAHGVYEIHLNGAEVGEGVLQPGWTSYHHRLRYATHDVTDLVRAGENVAGALLGDGWFRGNLPAGRNLYGERLGLLLQLEVTYLDGSAERVVSDTAWRAAVGPILASDLYNGETYDARREQPGWDRAGFDDGGWSRVEALAFDPAVLVAPTGPPARRTELVRPVSVTTSPNGRTLVDFGQNLVGRVRLTVSGEPGTEITLRHAEVLEGGELATRPLRSARATDRYALRGEGPETWEPRFTFHGFRYAEVSGWPGRPGPEDLVAVVLGSDLERTGWFECSHPLVERLHENVVWSMRGNTVEIPTDCPQRDERLGWTGDIEVFAPTAAFLYEVGGFLESWLADLAAEQAERGGVVPWVVPDALRGSPTAAAVWGDASVGVPWVLHQRLGDRGLLERQFPSMRAWVDAVAALTGSSGLWDRGFQFGDWLDPAAPPDQPGAARTDPHLIATAYLAHSAHLVALAADTLGDPGVATRYAELARRTREAFRAEYVTPAGRLVSDAPTAYALALCFDLLPGESGRRHAAERLVTLVRDGGHRIATGFVGTPLIGDALTRTGHLDEAYRLLLEEGCPSWLYPVTMGATTVWERWDSLLPDGSVNPGQMTSFNHYALGAVADWLHRTVAGLAPAAPGYRRMMIQPRPGGGMTRAAARHRTPYGMAGVSWALRDSTLTVEATVPPNTQATISLPGRTAFEVGSGSHSWTVAVAATPEATGRGRVRAPEVVTVPTAEPVDPERGQEVEVDGVRLVHNVRQPTLTVYRPDPERATGAGVVICPGGAYSRLAIAHEGSDLASWCVERGLLAFVLRYRLLRTPEDPQEFARAVAAEMATVHGESARAAFASHEPVAAADGRAAVSLARERAAAWGLDPNRLAMIGFSAGGRVALQAAASPRPEDRPDAVAAVYAPDWPALEVPRDAPPLLAVAAADDPLGAAMSPGLAAGWRAAGRPAELHLYPDGGHGFGVRRQGTASDHWLEVLETWLRNQRLLA